MTDDETRDERRRQEAEAVLSEVEGVLDLPAVQLIEDLDGLAYWVYAKHDERRVIEAIAKLLTVYANAKVQLREALGVLESRDAEVRRIIGEK